jgi:hypothetical protein
MVNMLPVKTFDATLQGVQRLKNSNSGNPQFRVFFNYGPPVVTEKDASVNHMVMNYIGQTVRVTLNESGHIIRIGTME